MLEGEVCGMALRELIEEARLQMERCPRGTRKVDGKGTCVPKSQIHLSKAEKHLARAAAIKAARHAAKAKAQAAPKPALKGPDPKPAPARKAAPKAAPKAARKAPAKAAGKTSKAAPAKGKPSLGQRLKGFVKGLRRAFGR